MLFTIKSAGYFMSEYDDILHDKFNYQRNDEDTYQFESEGTVELNSMEDFAELVKIINHRLIVDQANVITIYDDYIK